MERDSARYPVGARHAGDPAIAFARMAGSYVVVFLLVAGCAAPPPAPALPAQPTAAYDRAVDDVIAHYGVPGLAVGVIEHGKVVYTRTAGELVAGGGEPVDRHTRSRSPPTARR